MVKTRTMLPLADIEEWPEVNPRRSYDTEKMNLLGHSIQDQGVVEAVIVNHLDGRFLLVDGSRRVEAAERAKLTDIDVDLYQDLSIEACLDLVAASLHKRQFNVIEEARLIYGMWSNDQPIEHIARTTGYSDTTIHGRVDIMAHLDPEIHAMMIRDANPLPIHQALLLKGKPALEQIRLAAQIAPAGGPVLTESQTRELINPTDPLPLKEAPDPAAIDKSGQPDPAAIDKSGQPDPAPDAGPLKPPTAGTAKDPNMVGVKELAGVMTITGTLITKREGVLWQDAKLMLEGGTAAMETSVDSLMLDLGSDLAREIREFITADALALSGADDKAAGSGEDSD